MDTKTYIFIRYTLEENKINTSFKIGQKQHTKHHQIDKKNTPGISKNVTSMRQRLYEHFLMVFKLFFIKKVLFFNNKFFTSAILWALFHQN